MKAPPAAQVRIERFGGWRAAAAALGSAAGACGVMGAWPWLFEGALAWPWACLAALAGALLAERQARQGPVRLAWGGSAWTLDADERAGRARIAIDLGGWMLLRFDGDDGTRRWLPLARRDAGAAWHGLRCALLYSALPSSSAPAPDPRLQ